MDQNMVQIEQIEMACFDLMYKKSFKGFRGIGMVEWAFHLKFTHPHWKGAKYIPFIKIMRNNV
jgi:hypothetical protein